MVARRGEGSAASDSSARTSRRIEQTLYYRNEVRGYATRIQNLDWNPSPATEVWNIEDWWIKE